MSEKDAAVNNIVEQVTNLWSGLSARESYTKEIENTQAHRAESLRINAEQTDIYRRDTESAIAHRVVVAEQNERMLALKGREVDALESIACRLSELASK
jgi:hypothetical protein